MSMKQPGTDYGAKKGETGEHEPKGAKASDEGGEKKVRMVNGVGMGSADGLGKRPSSHMGRPEGVTGEFNDGTVEKVAYEHKRIPHDQDK